MELTVFQEERIQEKMELIVYLIKVFKHVEKRFIVLSESLG